MGAVLILIYGIGMMAQVEPFLDFRDDYILEQYDETVEHYEKTDQKTRPWSFGAHAFRSSKEQLLKPRRQDLQIHDRNLRSRWKNDSNSWNVLQS